MTGAIVYVHLSMIKVFPSKGGLTVTIPNFDLIM